MKILFCGGGTAGHVTPAIAVAEEMKRIAQGCDLLYVGREGGGENEAVRKAGIPLRQIGISPRVKRISKSGIESARRLLHAIRECGKILEEEMPDAVFSTGGYVSFPVLLAAQRRKIPTFAHESNAVSGSVTRFFAAKDEKVFLNFPLEEKWVGRLGDRCEVVGNPLPAAFGSVRKDEAREKLRLPKNAFIVLSYGGSGGARIMNDRLLEAMQKEAAQSILPRNKPIIHIHATGRSYYETYRNRYPELFRGGNFQAVSYLDDMAVRLSAADLAITRSGAMTLAELTECRTPAILIPSPNVTADHQRKNALRLVAAGAAEMVEEGELTADLLVERISALAASPEKIREKTEAYAIFGRHPAKTAREKIARAMCDKLTRK